MTTGTKAWFEFEKELSRRHSNATWIPLRSCISTRNGEHIDQVGFVDDGHFVGTVAFPDSSEEIAERVSWSDIGVSNSPRPYAFDDGNYKRCDEYQWNDGETVGHNFIFENVIPESGHTEWIIDPDIILAFGLQKVGNDWIRPKEDFCTVIREQFDTDGNPVLIEIRKEFLLDYLSARQLNLKISEYRQRVINFPNLVSAPYPEEKHLEEDREGARFSLLVRSLKDVFGGSAAIFKVWRTDFDHEEDSPYLSDPNDQNTEGESFQKDIDSNDGYRVEGEFWRDEVIQRSGVSERIRGDKSPHPIHFIVNTSGDKETIENLDNEDVGKWLFFDYRVVNDLLSRRGYSLKWYTDETGSILKRGDRGTHFGINKNDLINIYAFDIYLRPSWEQKVWSRYNVTPEGGISEELAASQVRATPASTMAPERKFIEITEAIAHLFEKTFKKKMYNESIDRNQLNATIHRFRAIDDASLYQLAKDISRSFMDSFNIDSLRTAARTDDTNLGSIKLLQKIAENYVGYETARKITAPLVGTYDLRLADAHPTSSKIEESFQLIGIDGNSSHLRRAYQLIDGFTYGVWQIGEILAETHKSKS